jgi:phage terminase small subunit
MVDGEADENGVTSPVTVTKAAQLAGYAKGNSGRSVASRTLRLPHVQAYLFKRVAEGIGLSAISAGHVIHRLALSAKSEYVQLEASKDILDRSGFKAPDKVSIQHEVAITIDLG